MILREVCFLFMIYIPSFIEETSVELFKCVCDPFNCFVPQMKKICLVAFLFSSKMIESLIQMMLRTHICECIAHRKNRHRIKLCHSDIITDEYFSFNVGFLLNQRQKNTALNEKFHLHFDIFCTNVILMLMIGTTKQISKFCFHFFLLSCYFNPNLMKFVD